MQFYEKLIFMMNLTQTSNRELAQAIHIDPAVISRLRTGKRGLPRNTKILRNMAQFFAGRCTTEYQRRALSEMTGIKRMITAKHDQLSEFLYCWFCGDTDGVERFMRTFESLSIGGLTANAQINPIKISTKGNFIYYGNEGKRAAVRAAYQHMLAQEDPGMICILADETDDWLMEDYDFTSNMQAGLIACVQKGFQICHIIPPIYSGDQILESLTRWIPLYMTGKVEAFFYPHIRDRLHRHSIIMVPGKISLASHSLAGRRTSYATMLTTDTRLIQATEEEFQDCLSMCRPMLSTFSELPQLFQCFMRFLTPHGFRIQKILSLSAVTAPTELIAESIDKRTDPEQKRLGRLYLEEIKKAEQNQDQYNLIDIVHLASAEQVRAGTVPITATCSGSEQLYYTPKTYAQHLKKILHILDTHESYHFVPLEGPIENESALMVKENHRALLVHSSEPFTVFEISQPEIVGIYREYLLRLAEKHGYTGIHRKRIKSRIQELIRELMEE
ncbi:hypothetical protein NXH76_00820 [Blautia schinkii]|nr:hypothetical protein [Blautia schinkii]